MRDIAKILLIQIKNPRIATRVFSLTLVGLLINLRYIYDQAVNHQDSVYRLSYKPSQDAA
jgi:hypothetical protein